MIRKLLLLSVLLIVFTVSAQAQSVKHWGFLAGYTTADQDWDPGFFDVEKRDGIHAGVYAEWLGMPHVSLVTELVYVQKGGGIEIFTTDESGPDIIDVRTDYAKFDYLSLSVLGKLALPSSTLSPYLLAGPRLDILIGHSQDNDFMALLNEEYETFVVGFTVGGGLQAPSILPGNIFVEFRANFDITDAYQGDNPDLVNSKIKNTSFDISLGVGL